MKLSSEYRAVQRLAANKRVMTQNRHSIMAQSLQSYIGARISFCRSAWDELAQKYGGNGYCKSIQERGSSF